MRRGPFGMLLVPILSYVLAVRETMLTRQITPEGILSVRRHAERRIKLFCGIATALFTSKSANDTNNVASNSYPPAVSFASVFNLRLLHSLQLHV